MVLKILVLPYIMGIMDVKYYFYENYIVKQYDYKTEEMKRISNVAYEMYDLKTNKIYIIPASKDQRNLFTGKLMEGTWKYDQAEITKVETEKTMYSSYECLKLTEHITKGTPLGSIDSRKITYLANVKNELKPYLKKKILLFLGMKDFTYKPYLFKILVESEHEEMEKPITIYQGKLQYEEADPFLPDSLLSLPIR